MAVKPFRLGLCVVGAAVAAVAAAAAVAAEVWWGSLRRRFSVRKTR